MSKSDLLVPVLGNHNATLFLLSYVIHQPGRYSLVLTPSDAVADKRIRELCHWLGVEVLDRSQVEGRRFRRIFLHPWNTESHPSSLDIADEIWIYADGLSGRVMASSWEQASGFLVWAPQMDFLDPETAHPIHKAIFLGVNEMSEIWSKLFQLTGLKPPLEKVARLQESTFIAMRYWGNGTYSSLSHFHASESLRQFAQEVSGSRLVLKRDSRWTLPFSQEDLVRRAFPGSKVTTFTNSLAEQARLGHLASLDSYIFTCPWPSLDFFGFDGSLGPTLLMTQPKVRVFLPELQDFLNPLVPIHRVVQENLDWQRSMATKLGNRSAIEAILQSDSMREALEDSRGGRALDSSELGERIRVVLAHPGAGLTGRDVAKLQALITQSQRDLAKQTVIDLTITSLRDSRWAQTLYFWAARFLPLRKLMVRASRLISKQK